MGATKRYSSDETAWAPAATNVLYLAIRASVSPHLIYGSLWAHY